VLGLQVSSPTPGCFFFLIYNNFTMICTGMVLLVCVPAGVCRTFRNLGLRFWLSFRKFLGSFLQILLLPHFVLFFSDSYTC
jgi:hypothetical protein